MNKIFYKLCLIVIITSALFFLNYKNVSAENEFLIDAKVEYIFNQNENTHIIYTIILENTFPDLYAKRYSLILDNLNIENVKSFENGNQLPLSVNKDGNKDEININFDNPLVGKGKKRIFTVEYDTKELLQKTGDVWEISIPKLSDPDSFQNYNVVINIPSSFGNLAYLTPNPQEKQQSAERIFYKFDKSILKDTSISAGFGNFQVFSFNLVYHLENPINKKIETKIPIPPDTALQKIYLTDINPAPESIVLDEDGNWMASYILNSRQRIDIAASGFVQTYSSPRNFTKPTSDVLSKNIQPQKYWEVDNPKIKQTADSLVSINDIYNYVVNNLTYDYSRVAPNVERKGALETLNNPKSAICMEFTDLFIALARAKGIPAREINGYAYTENSKIQPLSLVSDVLHSWPEYWNESLGAWIPVDPTWGNTTGGIDYFNKLDLRHFAFVIHGVNSQKPYPPGSYKLGSNPQKDVYINFSNLPNDKDPKIQITTKTIRKFPFINKTFKVNIVNHGPIALYNQSINILFDDKVFNSINQNVLLPYSKTDVEFNLPFSFFGKNSPSSIFINFAGEKSTIQGYRQTDLIKTATLMFLLLLMALIVIFAKLKNITFSKLVEKIKYGNKFKKDKN